MKNSLKNEADILDRHEKGLSYPKYDEKYSCEKRVDHDKLMKCSTYQKSISTSNKFGETESYSFTDSHNNHQLKYANISSSVSHDRNGRDYRNSHLQRYSHNQGEGDNESGTNISNDVGSSLWLKSNHNSTPLAPTEPIRLPYIINGGSTGFSDFGTNSQKLGSHHYSISETSSYAIGAGKTNNSNNLKATVSGGKYYLTGIPQNEEKERIEMKCTSNGKVIKQSPSKTSHEEGEQHFNNFYHKFRQQNQQYLKNDPIGYIQNKVPQKNRFPLPFTGIEYPFIDGGGLTSCGREGIYLESKRPVCIYNDFEKSWLYSLPDKFACTANERPVYKKKAKLEGKSSKVVYDCLYSSPYYSSAYESEHSVMIDLNREYTNEGRSGLEDQKSKSSGLQIRKDKYFAYLPPYYSLEDEYDSTLVFESRFESGNLRRAFK